MKTIDVLYKSLLKTSARYVKRIAVLDRIPSLYCSSALFLDELEKTFARTTILTKTAKTSPEDTCIIDSCDNYKQWHDLLTDRPFRVLEDPFVGQCEIYRAPDGLILRQDQGWIVFRADHGPLVFLNEKGLELDDPMQCPNPTGLVSILFSEILARSNKWLVHAGAAGHRGRCHLWTGHSGAGKTTRTLAHVANGYSFFGDDMVILGSDEKGLWHVWPYWRPLHVTRHTCELLPQVSGVKRPFSRNNKSSVEIEELFQVTAPTATPLEAIWLLTTETVTRPQRLEPQKAFTLLSPTFIHGFWPETTQANMEALLDIVFQVPVFKMSRTVPLENMADKLYAELKAACKAEGFSFNA